MQDNSVDSIIYDTILIQVYGMIWYNKGLWYYHNIEFEIVISDIYYYLLFWSFIILYRLNIF